MLLHSCCAPCATHPVKLLQNEFIVHAFFYNPNIHPEEEYAFRAEEIGQLGERWNFEVIVGDYDSDAWFQRVKGLEDEPERGKRCTHCFRMRLEQTAKIAKERGYDCFTSTLSLSPLKNANLINQIGKELESQYGVEFYEADFKKREGFKISCDLSREEGLYRQDYCGCVFSMRERDARLKK